MYAIGIKRVKCANQFNPQNMFHKWGAVAILFYLQEKQGLMN